MTVGSISGNGVQAAQPAANQSSDALSKSLQKQIAEKQSQMQELSANQELSVEEKMKKRQELQQQIFELQNQLRQHEIELRKEAQASQGNEMEEMLGGKRETKQAASEDGKQAPAVSQEGMAAMISADSAVSQAKVQGSVGKKMKGEARNLRTEAKLDGGRGGNTEGKLAAAATLEQKASQVEASQVKGLNEASQKISDATKTDSKKTEEAASKETGDIRVQYGDTVVMEISGEAIAALAESKKEEEAE